MPLFDGVFGRKSAWTGALGSLLGEWVRSSDVAGAPISDDSAMRVAAVLTCVRLIAQTVASLPLHMYRRRPDGSRGRVAVQNPLERLLAKPNPWQTPIAFREQLTAHLLLRGNAYAWIDWRTGRREDGQLIEDAEQLVPLHPDQVEVKQAGNGTQWAVEYALIKEDGGRLPIPAEEMLHLSGLSTVGVVGRSVIGDAREAIQLALFTQRYAAKFWKEDATPGVILIHPNRLTKSAADAIARQFDARHAGEAHRTAVLSEGMKLERLSVPADDAQFLETRKFSRAEIAGLFLVPPHMIGDVDRSTSWGTGIEQQQIGFLSYSIRPWLVRWEQAIKRALIIREDDYYVEHAVEGMLRGDIKSRYDAYAIGRQWGWLSANDIRRLENDNPIEGGDEYYRPLNMASVTSRPEGATA